MFLLHYIQVCIIICKVTHARHDNYMSTWYVANTFIRLMPKGINILSSYCLFLSLYLSISLSFSLSNFYNTAFQTGITPEVVDRFPPS